MYKRHLLHLALVAFPVITLAAQNIINIKVDLPIPTVSVGETKNLTASTVLNVGAGARIGMGLKWEHDSHYADDAGNADINPSTGDLTGRKSGVFHIMVTDAASKMNAGATVTINPGRLVAIEIVPPAAGVTVNGTGLFTVQGTFTVGAGGATHNETIPPALIHWNLNPGTFANIAANGLATGLKSGGAEKLSAGYIGTMPVPAPPAPFPNAVPFALNILPVPPSPLNAPIIQFVGKLQGGSMAVTVQGTATDMVTLYQFNSAYIARAGNNVCGKLDLTDADQTVSVLSGGTKQGSFTLAANAPQTIALNTPLIAGTQLCAVQSSSAPASSGAGAGDYSMLATVTDPGSYGRFTTYFTSGAVITNQQTSGTTSTASEYLDLNFDYSWARAGVLRRIRYPDPPGCGPEPEIHKNPCTKYHRGPGFDGFFAARLSTIPVAATATTNSTVTTTTTTPTTTAITTTNLNVLTTQQSAHIVLGGYLPFVFTRWNNKSYVMTLAPIAAAGFDTLLNPSITPAAAVASGAGTTAAGGTAQTTTSVSGNFSHVYSFYNSGLRVAWEGYPKSTDFAPMTWIELRATFGKYSNLPTYICSATPRGPYTTTSTGTPVVTPIANSACGNGIYSPANLNLLYDSRTLFQRIDIQAKAQFPNYPFVLGLDANLAQYSVGRNKHFVDYQNKAGNDVRIYIGVTFNLLSAIGKLNVGGL